MQAALPNLQFQLQIRLIPLRETKETNDFLGLEVPAIVDPLTLIAVSSFDVIPTIYLLNGIMPVASYWALNPKKVNFYKH